MGSLHSHCGVKSELDSDGSTFSASAVVSLYGVVDPGLLIAALASKMARSLTQVLQNAVIRPAQGKASAAVRPIITDTPSH